MVSIMTSLWFAHLKAAVIDITSLDRLYREWAGGYRSRMRALGRRAQRSTVENLLRPGVPSLPFTTPRHMRWLGSGRFMACGPSRSGWTSSDSQARLPNFIVTSTLIQTQS
jgi:hypothetical protein